MAANHQTRGGNHPLPVATYPQVVGRCVLALLLVAIAAPAAAQPAKRSSPPAPPTDVEPPKGKPKVFDFTGLDISGRLRTPQLLYFLDRATEELERASLERRSFIPEMVRSVDEGPL